MHGETVKYNTVNVFFADC